MIASGSVQWISDPSTVPIVSADFLGASVKDPEKAAMNAALFDQLVALRDLAVLLQLPEERGLSDEAADDDPSYDRVVRGAPKEVAVSPKSFLEDAFVRSARALGRRARPLRVRLRQERGSISATLKKLVPDARGGSAGAQTDVNTFVRREELEDLINSMEKMEGDPAKAMLSVDEATAKDVDFICGIVLAKSAFDIDTTARSMWRAVNRHDRARARAVTKDYKEEIAEARETRRDDRTVQLAVRAAQQAVGGGGGGGGGSAGGGRPHKQPTKQKLKQKPKAGGAALGDGGAGGGGDGPAAKTKAQVLALAPELRSNHMCIKHKLCRNCREPGHFGRDCTKAEVKYVGAAGAAAGGADGDESD